jgi:Mg2+/Co2+ transporter CorB
MILHYCESIPEQGQVLQIGNYRVKILKASNMKLDEVELKIQNK